MKILLDRILKRRNKLMRCQIVCVPSSHSDKFNVVISLVGHLQLEFSCKTSILASRTTSRSVNLHLQSPPPPLLWHPFRLQSWIILNFAYLHLWIYIKFIGKLFKPKKNSFIAGFNMFLKVQILQTRFSFLKLIPEKDDCT